MIFIINVNELTEEQLDMMLMLMQEEQKHKEKMNEIYDIMWKFKGRYVVLVGGSGSGKSYAVADRIIDRTLEDTKARVLCVRAQQKQVSESQFPLLWSRTSSGFTKKESPGHERIQHMTKGEIVFSGLDNNEKLKSIFDITSIWAEESDQILAADIRELDRRLRGYTGLMQIYLSFNPVSNLNWINGMFFSNRKKEVTVRGDNGQKVKKWIDRTLTVRGEVEFEDFPYYKDNPITDEMLTRTIEIYDHDTKEWVTELYYTTLLIHSTYRDNRFIDSAYRQTMAKLLEDDPEEGAIYANGQWGVPGGTFFDKKSINERIKADIRPIRTGYFDYNYVDHCIVDSSIQWVDDEDGYIRIFTDPTEDVPYVLSGDTAGEGSDWNTAFVINNITGEDVATLRLNYDEDLYARQVYCLGKYYGEINKCFGNALIGLEINHSSHPNKEIIRMGYDCLYIREREPDSITETLVARYGFRTTGTASGGGTRPVMLGMLRAIVREEPWLLKDMDFFKEATTFVKNEKGKPVAANGYHDDMIMARAIACYIADQKENYKRITRKENHRYDTMDTYVNELTSW